MTGRVRKPLPDDAKRRQKVLRDRARRAAQRDHRLGISHGVPIYPIHLLGIRPE